MPGTLPGGQVIGVSPKNLFFSFCWLSQAANEREKKLGDTPNPGREDPAPLKLTPKGDTPRPGRRLRPLHPHGLTKVSTYGEGCGFWSGLNE